MSGDWIKMRMELQTHPKVFRIMSACKADRLRVIGGLHAVWCVFDSHSADGTLDGYTKEAMDAVTGFPGFSSAMVSVGWLEEIDGKLVMPRFSEHNGKSAKRRAMDSERKRNSRESANSPDNIHIMSASHADKNRTREEKRRVNTTPLPPGGFDVFWTYYPRKEGKANAIKAFQKIAPDDNLLAKILGSLEAFCTSDQWRRDGGQFVPHAATWLNQRRWEDEIEIKQTGLAWAQGAI